MATLVSLLSMMYIRQEHADKQEIKNSPLYIPKCILFNNTNAIYFNLIFQN